MTSARLVWSRVGEEERLLSFSVKRKVEATYSFTVYLSFRFLVVVGRSCCEAANRR